MTAIVSTLDALFEICNRAVSGGYLVAMGVICSMQYLYHLNRSHRATDAKDRLCRQIDDIQKDLRVVTRDRTLTSLENQILREFAGELDLDRTIEQLIRRLASENQEGFAAYLSLAGTTRGVTHSRGLSDKTRAELSVDPSLLSRVAREGVLMLRKSELYNSKLQESLSPSERTRGDRLFLAGIGTTDNLVGVVVTTSLIPAGAPLDQQIELVKRLTQSLSGVVQRNAELEERDRKLQSIHEIMELRAVTDQKHASPLDMIEAFVDRLREMIGAERAVLFLINPEGRTAYKPLCRCGVAPAAGSAKRHADYEMILAETALSSQEPEMFDAAQLGRIGIQNLMGSAIVAPVVSPNGIAGALCLTRGAKEPFTAVRWDLITWGARYLSETLLRALHQAVSEWHARQDPLTDLSNRRTFDREFPVMLQSTAAARRSCALLMVDIDHFKGVNDRYGHIVGDEVLRAVSRMLKESVARLSCDSSGLAARYGGEEFALILPGNDAEQAGRIAESIRSTIELTPILAQQSKISVTVSVGIAASPEGGLTLEELLTAADGALYQAKTAGRNRIVTAALTSAS